MGKIQNAKDDWIFLNGCIQYFILKIRYRLALFLQEF